MNIKDNKYISRLSKAKQDYVQAIFDNAGDVPPFKEWLKTYNAGPDTPPDDEEDEWWPWPIV